MVLNSDTAGSKATGAELSVRAVILGLFLSAVLGAANVYLGLKVGMTVSASIPAAVVAMLLLRRVFRGGTVLEANQVQTAASAGESLAAGILFTVPALVLIGAWGEFDYWATTWIAIAGGWLGILFMIPMRRVFIEESPELPYPEGVACAAVLESARDDANSGEGRSVLQGGLLGAVVKVCVAGVGLFQSSVEHAVQAFGSRSFFLGADLSPALLAVGYIVRIEVAIQIFLGGAIGWLVLIPLAPEWTASLAASSEPLREALRETSATERAWSLWSTGVRYVGVGAMAVGGVAALVHVRRGLVRAVAELRKGWGAGAEQTSGADLPGPWIAGFSLAAVAIVATLYVRFTGDYAMAGLTTLIMVVASFFFVGVASYIVGLVGNSNSPVSGMTITAVLLTGGMLWLFGYSGMQGMLATLGVAAVVCCAACTAGDVCNDLKTGAIVGATPRRQQIMQLAGVVVAALVMAPVLQLLHDAYGIGSRELAAPQASLFASLARGFFGDETLPWGLVALGAGLGLGVLFLDRLLERRGSSFRLHLMPVAVGLYLPFGLAVPIMVGGLVEWISRVSPDPRPTAAKAGGGGPDPVEVAPEGSQKGILFSSGVVAGEALVGVGIALWIGLGGHAPEFAWSGRGELSLIAALAVVVLFARGTRVTGSRRSKATR
jgi:putative OPT family oligopeptide transporter